jgi:hypothetical protein
MITAKEEILFWKVYANAYIILGSRDSSLGIATGYGLDDPGSIPGSAKCFSSPQCPDRL